MPPKVHPVAPREVYGCSQFWKRAGAEFLAFGVWLLGPQPADSGAWGHSVGVPCGARGAAANPAWPMAPAVPRAPCASPPAISVAGWINELDKRAAGMFLGCFNILAGYVDRQYIQFSLAGQP